MDKRNGMCPWRDIDHLKSAYSKIISSDEIDKIIDTIKKKNRFKKRFDATERENEEQLLNLVDSIITSHIKNTYI